jgi:hypothetical protein
MPGCEFHYVNRSVRLLETNGRNFCNKIIIKKLNIKYIAVPAIIEIICIYFIFPMHKNVETFREKNKISICNKKHHDPTLENLDPDSPSEQRVPICLPLYSQPACTIQALALENHKHSKKPSFYKKGKIKKRKKKGIIFWFGIFPRSSSLAIIFNNVLGSCSY